MKDVLELNQTAHWKRCKNKCYALLANDAQVFFCYPHHVLLCLSPVFIPVIAIYHRHTIINVYLWYLFDIRVLIYLRAGPGKFICQQTLVYVKTGSNPTNYVASKLFAKIIFFKKIKGFLDISVRTGYFSAYQRG